MNNKLKKPHGIRALFTAINNLYKSGFFNIFGATVINSMVSFVYGIFIVRIMSEYNYGVFSYVQNIANFGIMFSSLGCNLGVLQFCSSKESLEQKFSYSRFAAIIGSICSVLMIGIMVAYTYIDNSSIDNLTLYIVEFSFLPLLFFGKEWVTSNLRWQLKNREYGNVMNIHSVTNAVFAVIGAYLASIHGVIIGIYLAYLCSIILGLYYLREQLASIKQAASLDRVKKNIFMKYSVTMCIVNALISVLFTVDLFVIGNIMHDAETIAMYKTACVIPFALNMVPNSIMTFVYPHVAANRNDKTWLRKNIKILYLANGVLNFGIGVMLYIMAPVLIPILFGNKYNGILPVFRLLAVSYIVSACFRTPAANLFGILRKTKTALVVSTGTVVLCVVMGITLVSKLGIIGAAYGSIITFGTVGLISTGILFKEIYLRKD